MMSTDEFTHKIVIVGDIGTGKTSIVKRSVLDIFSNSRKYNISGMNFANKRINLDDTRGWLKLCTIAGQERFGNKTEVYYQGAVGAFIVFDVTRASTFAAVLKWKADIDSKALLPNNQKLPIVILANKCDCLVLNDLENLNIDKFCADNDFVGWFKTSAKDNIGIEDAVTLLVNEIQLINV